VSKPSARTPTISASGFETSLVRTTLAAFLVLLGIAWMTFYTHAAMDAAEWVKGIGEKPDTPFTWMSDIERWNYLIGFGLILVGLVISAHKKTPLGRGRGVVVGMLFCFLFGLAWIVTYYFVAQSSTAHIPVMDKLDQSNLLVGVGFMAVGFTYATKWE
jgi:hypothetical protein